MASAADRYYSIYSRTGLDYDFTIALVTIVLVAMVVSLFLPSTAAPGSQKPPS